MADGSISGPSGGMELCSGGFGRGIEIHESLESAIRSFGRFSNSSFVRITSTTDDTYIVLEYC